MTMMMMMDAYSPINSYAVGAVGLGLGLHALLRPRQEYRRFGLPLELEGAPRAAQGPNKDMDRDRDRDAATVATVSPLIYVKAVREITYGLALIGLEYQGDKRGATTLIGIMALAGLGDGLIVWFHGGDELRWKAVGHWAVAGLGLGSWAAWRAFRAYGEWAAFHALGY